MAERRYPRSLGGGWYELSDGSKVQSAENADSAQRRIDTGAKMAKTGDRNRGKDEEPGTSPYEGERELVFVASPDAALRAGLETVTSMSGQDVSDLNEILASAGATARPMFGLSEERLIEEATALEAVAQAPVPDLTLFYKVEAPDSELDALLEKLQAAGAVDAAYIKPPAEPAVLDINTMAPAPEDAPPATPSFVARQGYLVAAPGGVDANWAGSRPGGRGAGIRTIDIEGAWRFTHEDLLTTQGGVVGGTQSTDIRWRNHGTAVIGEIGGDVNSIGITGIAPDTHQTAISIFGGMGSSNAIRTAANRLQPGDIILIELHRPGPRHAFQQRDDQLGYIAIEWWEDDFAAIAFAVSRGVIVVEAAGNGAENLDDPLYNTPGPGFPSMWRNPFNRTNRDSGAIVVGAGAPPPGTHGRDHGPDRSRLDFSNWGSMVDAQGWGREVTTAGYGSLQGGSNEDLWYTDTFSGTSSASPIIVGALAAIQGMLRAAGKPLLTPARARSCLRSTGSPQQDAPGRPRTQRIGNRPDIPALWRCAAGIKIFKEAKELAKDTKEFVKERDIKLSKDTKERAKDIKDLKERKEVKEGKEFKEKDKDIKEGKEIKEGIKEIREGKLVEIKDRKEIFEGKISDVIDRKLADVVPHAGMAPDWEDRISNLEQLVEQLAHFIAPDLRPDVGGGALMYEDELDQASLQAKEYKDAKDVEKLPE